jgi:hypothetical protein
MSIMIRWIDFCATVSDYGEREHNGVEDDYDGAQRFELGHSKEASEAFR